MSAEKADSDKRYTYSMFDPETGGDLLHMCTIWRDGESWAVGFGTTKERARNQAVERSIQAHEKRLFGTR